MGRVNFKSKGGLLNQQVIIKLKIVGVLSFYVIGRIATEQNIENPLQNSINWVIPV